ncbi:MAG: glucose-6-phosphate dehydrogenase [Alphaproteobacteria bacterium]|nr:glucose-6-phosphate dehydrogenase [Alphaproteobacteria bacterium]
MTNDERPRAEKPEPCSLVVFGASGDLTHRLLLPALYNLARGGLLPEAFRLVGVARSPMSDDAFRDDLASALRKFAIGPVDEAVARKLLASATYLQGDADDPPSFARLRQALEQSEAARQVPANRLYYLATPPAAFAPIALQLGEAGLAKENGAWRRIIIEKPFGTDLASAQKLNRELREVFEESQIYRIDHYLGKETVQNILVLRFANGLFEPIWNRDHIDHVQITVAETLDVGRRGRFYDQTGALRDMVPNHLFQLLSLVAMEPPSRFDAHSVRSEKADVLDAVQQQSEADALRNAVRAQYSAGHAGNVEVADYRAAENIRPDSVTETYAALKLQIDNWRWAGVPFFLRTGKALEARLTEVAIKFKQAPFAMFRDTPIDKLAQNFLVLRIQPDECITLTFNAKVPGPTIRLDGVGMTFRYKDYFDAAPSTGYETLIYDCMIGDAILFQRADGVEAGWRAVQPVLDAWRNAGEKGLSFYRAGSAGPVEADQLIRQNGRAWRSLAEGCR